MKNIKNDVETKKIEAFDIYNDINKNTDSEHILEY